ncbi:MAG: alpha/beta fold hydrolase [Phycisphaerales bacterium]
MRTLIPTITVSMLLAAAALNPAATAQATPPTTHVAKTSDPVAAVRHRTVDIDGVSVFYREAGPKDAPVVLLLHGFPTSSHMFRNLIPHLAERYRVIAPDYPGFGHSDMPPMTQFDYTFDNYADLVDSFLDALHIERFSLYVMDYGAPVGFRILERHPERIESLVVQNGNAYDEGLREFWDPIKVYWNDPSPPNRAALAHLVTLDATKWQYTHGVRDVTRIDPDSWTTDQHFLDRPGNDDIQLALFYDYQSNVPLYPAWQASFREHQFPTLIVWGKNDFIFPVEGAYPYLRDLPNAEFHLVDTGHFVLEEDAELTGSLMVDFLDRNVSRER